MLTYWDAFLEELGDEIKHLSISGILERFFDYLSKKNEKSYNVFRESKDEIDRLNNEIEELKGKLDGLLYELNFGQSL